MNITIFAKKRTTPEGKPFFSYLGKLAKTDGSEITATIKFIDDAGRPKPEDCPMNILVDKKAANLVTRQFTRDDTGEVGIGYTLYVSAWNKGEAYVDHSLDEFVG